MGFPIFMLNSDFEITTHALTSSKDLGCILDLYSTGRKSVVLPRDDLCENTIADFRFSLFRYLLIY